MPAIKEFIITIIVFFSVDIFWLAFIARKLYRKHLAFIMAENINVVAALIFYMVYIIGLLHFVIRPAIDRGDLKTAIINGMFFGFITYSTYDLTNLATLRNWPITITIIDITWGTILCALVSAISYTLLK